MDSINLTQVIDDCGIDTAAEIMGVSTKQVRRYVSGQQSPPAERVERLRSMINAPAEAQVTHGGRRLRFAVLTPSQLADVRTKTVWEEGGYQRKISHFKVNAIQRILETDPEVVFPPVYLVETDGALYALDGQHRVQGHLAADAPCLAMIVALPDRIARKNFAIHNGQQSKVTRRLIKHGQRDDSPIPVKQFELAEKYQADVMQVDAIFTGLSGRPADDVRGDLDQEVAQKAEIILREWTNCRRWVPMKPHSISRSAKPGRRQKGELQKAYNSNPMLQCWGEYGRHVSRAKLRQVIQHVRDQMTKSSHPLIRRYGGSHKERAEMLSWIRGEADRVGL